MEGRHRAVEDGDTLASRGGSRHRSSRASRGIEKRRFPVAAGERRNNPGLDREEKENQRHDTTKKMVVLKNQTADFLGGQSSNGAGESRHSGAARMIPTAEDRERFQAQSRAVLAHLQKGLTLTQDQARELYGIMRLAARTSELRREGWNIVTTMIPAGENGACVAEYSLPADRPRIERRFLPVIKEGIPDELKALDRWVLWRATFRNGKTTKVPYSIDGQKAKSNDPRTWTTFDLAYAEYEAGRADGIGFNFSVDDDILGIDLDDCVCEDGMIKPQAMKIVESLDSFTEYSVSGKGLHVICRAPLKKGVRKGPCEVYPFGRYFTVTGHVFDERTELKKSASAVKALVALLKPPKRGNSQKRGGSYVCNNALVEKARNAANGPKFRRLFDDGDISEYQSHSEADLALLSLLLFWCNGDEDRADVLFRQSALCRGKWLERADYRQGCFEYLRGRGD